jgi:hypothetical protein
MDVAVQKLAEEKAKLLERLAEITVEEQRRQGLFQKVPHFSQVEEAGHQLGQFLSRFTQARLANEIAAGERIARECPTCRAACSVEMARRTVTGIDGPLEMLEPKAHCPACRRDFFPST